MKDTVAIVGSHPDTSAHFDFTRTDCDIWVFNEALALKERYPRADAVLQMHNPVIWRSATNRNDPKHYEWLQSGETPVIYMQDKYEDVPKSERFPLMELFEAFPQAEKYFTSSVAYALALAVYLNYKIIEVYGVEMETNSEYGHQRVGVAYWCGVAAGRGIYVDFHSRKFFKAPLYGYEGDVRIPIEFYQKRLDILQPHIDGINQQIAHVKGMIDSELSMFKKTYKADLTELDTHIIALGQNYHNLGMMEGAKMTNEHYKEKSEKMQAESGDYLIVRQEYEGNFMGAGKGMQEANKHILFVSKELEDLRKALDTQENKDIREKAVNAVYTGMEKYIKATAELGRLTGIAKENRLMVIEYDTYLRASGLTGEQAKALAEQPVEAEA